MLIPRFSIRWLLGLTTFSAGISLVLAQAAREQAWALGVMAGLWTFVVLAVLFSGAFLCAWLIDQASAGRRKARGAGDSPFAKDLPEVASFGHSTAQPAADLPPPLTG